MQGMNVYTTVDGGRTHVAFDQCYQGSINSYNNWFTKFFAKLFGKTIDVAIGGKTRRLNKNSYLKFLNSHGNAIGKKDLKQFCDFSTASVKNVIQNHGYMRDNISRTKSQKLYRKMVGALAKNSVSEYRVRKLVGRGAEIQKPFWIREGRGISFGSINQGLPTNKLKFKAQQLTPALLASKKGLKSLVGFMHKYSPNLRQDTGKEVVFKREITGVDRRENVDIEARLNPVVRRDVRYADVYKDTPYGIWHARQPVVQYRRGYQTKFVPVRKTTISTRYEDKVKNLKKLYFNNNMKISAQEEWNAPWKKTQGTKEEHFKEDIRPFGF